MRRQATNLEKIFARYISDKGVLSKIYKDLLYHDQVGFILGLQGLMYVNQSM